MSGILGTVLNAASILFGGSGGVTLGSVALQDFEVPETIRWGTDQQIAVHTYPGGARRLQAMGPDPADIAWSGIMLGPAAASRARALEQIAKGGQLVPLTWGSFAYTVMVASFSADYRRENWQGQYSVTCKVQPGAGPAVQPTLLGSCLSDIGSALGIDLPATLTAATGAMQTVQNDLGAVTSLTGGSAVLVGLQADVASASGALGIAQGAADTALGSTAASVASTGLIGGASGLAAAVGQAGSLAGIVQAGNFVARIGRNLAAVA